MPAARARVFSYRVDLDREWAASSDGGGPPLPREEAWTPEHLLLAGLARCTLTALEYHAKRAGITFTSTGSARGTVTRREEDGRFALVEADLDFEVAFDPPQPDRAARELVAKAERDCFVGASLRVTPRYRWVVQGRELA